MRRTAPYGSWPSPIDARLAARDDGRPGWLSTFDGRPWWVEPRPAEGGRVALVRGDGESPSTVLPAPWNVRSRVHEYGGRAYVVVPGRSGPSVVFSEFSDQRLYRFEPDADAGPRPITPVPERPSGLRYVEPIVAPGGHEVWCVREEHVGPAPTDVRRAIVAVPLDGSACDEPAAVRVVASDRHFLACPRVSPDGRRLSWIGWDHPMMPWDGTEVRVASLLPDGTTGPAVTVAGGPDESVVQAEWEADTSLLVVTDLSGWWNLHRVSLERGRHAGPPTPLCPRDEEFGGALWNLGMQWFRPLGDGRVAVIHGRPSMRLGILDLASGELHDVGSGADPAVVELTEWAPTLAADGSTVWGVAGGPLAPAQVVAASADRRDAVAVRPPDPTPGADLADLLPRPVARTFGGPGGRDVHATVYPPRHAGFTGPDDTRPPYLVFVHGGPTSRVPAIYDLEIAYFTSRGLGVVEVEYGGSTGYGRAYRNRLRENWGVVDVEDCAAVAEALVAEGTAEPGRVAVRGGSAGGWTSAAALTFTDTFACATIMYPILDLAAWRDGETHDFESQYLDSLVGPWPETAQRYRDRSPVNHAGAITAPFVLLQGLEDEICPPAQAERLLARIADQSVPHAYVTFEGEQHGFRREETIVTALEAELSLYAQVFGFTPAGALPTLELSR